MAEEEKKEAAGGKPEKAAAAPGAEGAAAPATDGAASPDEQRAARHHKARGLKSVPVGIAYIKATFNNTIVSITDPHGAVIAWSSAGRAGFKGSRKSTAFAATLVGQETARQAVGRGMREIEVRIQGAGAGRESAVRALQAGGLGIAVIKDVTPIPHNGCRARKRRRV